MPKHPTPYRQGLRDGLLLPVIINLNGETEMAHDILDNARRDLQEARQASAEAGYEEELLLSNVLASQAAAAALISIAESLGMLATTAHDDLEYRLRNDGAAWKRK